VQSLMRIQLRPANILLSEKQVPVLVDFGFAEKYDLEKDKERAFRSNLTYGTPEVCISSSGPRRSLISSKYLSPERARGLPHDTRKADMWSLGVTFFEILIGRTPFEHTEGEPFTTKAALEDYWARTVRKLASDVTFIDDVGQMRGKWLGSWKMSKAAEKMLRCMIQPNADLRCTAPEVLQDPYWDTPLSASGPKKATSNSTPEKAHSRRVVSPWSSRRTSKMQQSEREQTTKNHDDNKENSPLPSPNTKKAPGRQRVLSGTDGELHLCLSRARK
jgi:serine/threonine protein kinase